MSFRLSLTTEKVSQFIMPINPFFKKKLIDKHVFNNTAEGYEQ